MAPAGEIMTVTGPILLDAAGFTDGHNHLWIEPVAGAAPGAPVLADELGITAELRDFRVEGGQTIIDCQPGGCGRNGRMLRQLAEESGVHIIACTGFHLRRYYGDDLWLWAADATAVHAYFVRELTQGLDETGELDLPVRAGYIKIACEEEMDLVPQAMWEAAARAAVDTDSAIEVHTERGAQAQRIVDTLTGYGLPANRLVLCHVDKRPDFAFHQALAQQGVLLEYDTFYRPKYDPERNVWPLIEKMIASGFEDHVVVAADMADRAMWQHLGSGPGLTGLMCAIKPRLEKMGFGGGTIKIYWVRTSLVVSHGELTR